MKILVFPQDANPYQSLLYGLISKTNEVAYLNTKHSILAPLMVLELFNRRASGFKILHIHWLYPFGTRTNFPLSKKLSFINTLLFVYSARLLGYKIVWTVHNTVPHEQITSNDLLVRRKLAGLAAVKILHSKRTLKEMRKLGINSDNCVVIPHGNYIGVYPDNISRARARQKLNIKNNEFVILFFGSIHPYKGLEDLLVAFKECREDHVRLVIAGRCLDEVPRQIVTKAAASQKIDFYDGFVDEKNVTMYFKACDVVCLPFKSISTSGSALLALSFGKPIIAPRIGALLDMPSNVGFFYDPRSPDSLQKSMKKAMREKKLSDMSYAALRYANSLSWFEITNKTLAVYERIL